MTREELKDSSMRTVILENGGFLNAVRRNSRKRVMTEGKSKRQFLCEKLLEKKAVSLMSAAVHINTYYLMPALYIILIYPGFCQAVGILVNRPGNLAHHYKCKISRFRLDGDVLVKLLCPKY